MMEQCQTKRFEQAIAVGLVCCLTAMCEHVWYHLVAADSVISTQYVKVPMRKIVSARTRKASKQQIVTNTHSSMTIRF